MPTLDDIEDCNVHGVGTLFRDLPGSQERMIGGPHKCMYFTFDETDRPELVTGWLCNGIYVHKAHPNPAEQSRRVLSGEVSGAALQAVRQMRTDRSTATNVLVNGAHGLGHPLPGVYTVTVINNNKRHRVD